LDINVKGQFTIREVNKISLVMKNNKQQDFMLHETVY